MNTTEDAVKADEELEAKNEDAGKSSLLTAFILLLHGQDDGTIFAIKVLGGPKGGNSMMTTYLVDEFTNALG